MTQSNESSVRTKARAIFLTALMVLSVIAMTTAFTGSVAASHADEELQTGQTYWQGQLLRVNNSAGNIDNGDVYQIRTDDDANTLVRERTVDNASHLTVSTSGLDGNYNLTWVNDTGNNNVDYQFEVVPQSLSSTFADDSVANTGSSTNVETDLEIDSNRGTFDVGISATVDGSEVDAEDVNDTLPSTMTLQSVDTVDDVVYVTVTGGSTYSLNFTGQAAGTWELSLAVNDTDATASDTIEVQDVGAGAASFGQGTTEVAQGGIAEIPITLSAAAIGGSGELVIGNFETDGYQANVTFADGDADGQVTVVFNTYSAGDTGASSIVSAKDPDDSVTFSSTGDQSTLASRMLSTGDYEIYVSTSADDPSATVDSPDGFATLFIAERSGLSSSVWTAPTVSSLADAQDVNDALAEGTVTQDGTIAYDDLLIIQVQGSGLEGMVDRHGLSTVFSTDRMNLSAVQSNPAPNRDPKELNVSTSGGQLTYIADADNDSYYIVLDVTNAASWERNGSSVNLAAGDEFNASVELRDDRLLRTTDDAAHEAVHGDFEVVDRTLRWTLGVGGTVQVEAGADQVVSGGSSAAAGTEVQIRLQSTGDTEPRFVKTTTVEVQEDGTWEATFDFSSQATGDTFSARARIGGDQVSGSSIGAVTEDGEVVDEVQVGTPAPRTVLQPSPTPPVLVVTKEVTREVTRTVIQERTVTVTQTPGQPGFGIAVAIVALLAAALLAVRRRD